MASSSEATRPKRVDIGVPLENSRAVFSTLPAPRWRPTAGRPRRPILQIFTGPRRRKQRQRTGDFRL